MQLCAGMPGARETASAEHAGVHAEIATVLLHEDVGRDLGGPEDAVGGIVEAHLFGNAVFEPLVAPVDLPALVQLDQRETVRCVSVDLVGGREDERRLGSVESGRLEEIERTHGVHLEIGEGLLGCPVVRWLGRGVNDQRQI